MAITRPIASDGSIEVIDAQSNDPRDSNGKHDVSARDRLRIHTNGVRREVRLQGFNDDELSDDIPIVGSLIPDFASLTYDFDDFHSFNDAATDGDWVTTQATAGTADIISSFGGVLELDCNSTTDDQGIQTQKRKAMFKLATGSVLKFGCRVQCDLPTKGQFFCGLSVIDTSFFASGEASATDYVGFIIDATKQAGADEGKFDLEIDAASGSAVASSNAATLVANTAITLEFVVDCTALTLTPIVDGVEGTAATIVNLPSAQLAPTFACLSEDTDDPILLVDWFYCWQTR